MTASRFRRQTTNGMLGCQPDKHGTIFEVSMLDKVESAMPPSGKNKMKHPKYVVCEDTGSAIKGENRLDFYTGSYGLKSTANIFGSTASDLFKMFGNKSCHPNKTFRARMSGVHAPPTAPRTGCTWQNRMPMALPTITVGLIGLTSCRRAKQCSIQSAGPAMICASRTRQISLVGARRRALH